MYEITNDSEAMDGELLRTDTLQRVLRAAPEIAEVYMQACVDYGMNPGVLRIFAVGSIVKNNGKDFGTQSDVDLIFSVEHPEESLSAIPVDASSRSEAESERESRHLRVLYQFEEIWEQHAVKAPLNIPHGESMPEVWGLPLRDAYDFSDDKPGLLLAELKPQTSDQ